MGGAGVDPGRYTFDRKPKANPKAIVGGTRGAKYRFTVLTDRLLRYEWSEDGGFEDRASTFAFFRDFEAPEFRVIDEPDNLEIITEHFHMTYNKQDFTPEGFFIFVGTETWRYEGKNYGDLNGTARTLDGVDGRLEMEPGILSRKEFAVLDDSKSMLFGDDGFIASRVPGRKDGYVFLYKSEHKDAIKDFYRLSGSQPLLPRWALGNWWSRYHEYTAQEYIDLMDHFEAEEIPLTVGVVDMDWHLVNIPKKYGSGWTGYTWNRDFFPDPEAFMKQLHDRGLKVTLNDHPADGIRAFEDLYETVAKSLKFDTSNGDPIKFDPTDKKFLDAYFDVLKYNLEVQGVDFWWVDWQQGTKTKIPGIDPLWVLNHYHYLTSLRNTATLGQPLTFSRYAGPGSHRYPIGFSGDTVATWDSLHFQPEFTATASNIGYGWWSHDIGGHYWGSRSSERTARWVQLGCFSPILRLHSTKSEWNSKEPWLLERNAFEVVKHFMVLRHRMIPFLFTMNVRAHAEGEPIIQPMYWNHKDGEAYSVPNQYYFGPDLIVAPITTPTSTVTLMGHVRVWLPAGRYVDLFHPGLVYDGGRYIHIGRVLSEIPVFAKEGTMLPVDASPQLGNNVANPDNIEIMLVVGADASFELVEQDDSARPSPNTTKDSLFRTPIRWDQKAGKLSIGPVIAPAGVTVPKTRNYLVKLVGHTTSDISAYLPAGMSVLSRANHSTMVSLGAVSAAKGVEVRLGDDLQLDVVDVEARLHDMLYRCEVGDQLKEPLWDLILKDTAPVHVRMQRLYELVTDEDMRGAVMEIWFADARAGVGAGAGAGDGKDGMTGGRRLVVRELEDHRSRSVSRSSWDMVRD